MNMKLVAFFIFVLATGQVCSAGPLCFNGDLTGPQTRSIDDAQEQIEALSQLTDDTLTMETAEILYGPPIVMLNDRQTRQAIDLYGGLFTQPEPEPTEAAPDPSPKPVPSNPCRTEQRTYYSGGRKVVHNVRVCQTSRSSVSYQSQNVGVPGTGSRTTRYRTVQTVPVQQRTVYRTVPLRSRRSTPPHQYEVQICRDPAVVRQFINYARNSEGNLVQVAQLDNKYQSIENQPECPTQLIGEVGTNVVCRRKWVDVPAVVIPLRGGNRKVQLTDIKVPRCFAHVTV